MTAKILSLALRLVSLCLLVFSLFCIPQLYTQFARGRLGDWAAAAGFTFVSRAGNPTTYWAVMIVETFAFGTAVFGVFSLWHLASKVDR